jgi:putative membrane protein
VTELPGIHLDVVAGVGLVAGAWAAAWLVRGARPRPAETTALTIALALLLIMLNGPIHELSDHYLFSVHMAQHLVLTLVVAPLLLVATPAWMIDGVLRRRRLARAAHAVTRPLPALALYTVTLVAWHLPRTYNHALDVHAWHIVQHLMLIATAVVAWWPVVARSHVAPRLSYAGQILYLFAFGLPMSFVAAMITGAETVLYPFYASAPRLFGLTAFADQRLGGVIMWVPAGIVPLVAFTIVFFRWAAAEADRDEAVPARLG